LFFVARQRPDILRHCSHVFHGAVLDSVRIVFLFLELFWLFYGNECTDHKVSATHVRDHSTTILCFAQKFNGFALALVVPHSETDSV